jgi:hypothetical protein
MFAQTVNPSPAANYQFDYRPKTISVVAVVTNTVANQLHASISIFGLAEIV